MTNPKILAPLVVVGFILALALFGPLFVHYDAFEVINRDRLMAPGSTTSGGGVALFGTDQLGRDLLAQVVQGSRVSIFIGVTTLLIAGSIGSAIGIISGFKGGVLDSIFMRIADVQLAIPSLLLAIFIAAFLGQSVRNVIITLAITRWVVFARVARSQVLAVRKREFVENTSALGASTLFVIRRCIIPTTISPLVVVATVELGLVIVAEASLSFLGLGTPATTPSWGLTIANGRDYLATAWWIATIPGVCLAAVVISVGMLGDQLRDRLDPYMRAQASL